MTTPTAVLLMADGEAPSSSEEDVRGYLERIFSQYRNAVVGDDDVVDLARRYETIGGSPVRHITSRLVEKLQRALDEADAGAFSVRLAMKHSRPFIGDVVRELSADGISTGIGVTLTPFRSRLTTDAYHLSVTEAAGSGDSSPWRFVTDWHLDERFLGLWERRIGEAVRARAESQVVLFATGSLPAALLPLDDPYPVQFQEAAAALAERLGVEDWGAAFQSAGRGGRGRGRGWGQPWMGPSLFEVVGDWVSRGREEFVIAPIGFLMDRVEVLYDLDVDAKRMATELGIRLRRIPMPNDDSDAVEMLAALVWEAAAIGRDAGASE